MILFLLQRILILFFFSFGRAGARVGDFFTRNPNLK